MRATSPRACFRAKSNSLLSMSRSLRPRWFCLRSLPLHFRRSQHDSTRDAVVLVNPQFEAGKEFVGKGGIVNQLPLRISAPLTG